MPYIDLFNPFEIIVGTSEQYLLGYKVNNIKNEYKIEKTFAVRSHITGIRAVATSKHYLASVEADDVVSVYDLNNMRECKQLTFHNDIVNCVAFTPGASRLITCSNDGSIAAVRCSNWQIVRRWKKAHRGLAVHTLAIHPMGKLVLSTGMDSVLRTWNLRGRQVCTTNLVPKFKYNAKTIRIIRWNPIGDKYLLAINQEIHVYDAETDELYNELAFESEIICVEFLNNNMIAVGFENGQLKVCFIRHSKITLEMTAHDVRVQSIVSKNNLLVSASSSGEIKFWKYNTNSLDMVQSINCGVGITFLALQH